MRTLSTLLLLTLAAAPLAAQQHKDMKDPDKTVQGGGTLPTGWSARTDRNAPLTNVKFVTMGTGLHATMGPAAIFWQPGDTATGDFHTLATFTQMKAPMHPEAYGLIIGGSDLSGAGQRYTYLIIRGDGKFMIKRRNGDSVSTVVPWTANDAVIKAGADGKATNEVSIQSKGGTVSFMVNGKEVHSGSAADFDTKGIVGLRVNHNLDVHIAGFAVHHI
ncbi:MAG TPA: hypothetical protein VLC11_04320 [Gemmatimonadales bacterium]|nr:hypothetical protein [Gemmatimonadales bacterium]